MDLAELKERFGQRLTLVGGMHKYFFGWDCPTQEAYLRTAVSIGRKGGGYILMDCGGIPENVTPECFDLFLEMSHRVRAA
jgi:uroporphyrinogen-III decarboxylase